MDLNLPKEYMLLALHNKKGKSVIDSLSLNYGLAGALLLELTAMDKLEIRNKKLVITDVKPTGQKAYDEAMSMIKAKSGKRRAKHWVHKLGSRGNKFRKMIVQELVAGGILKRKEKRFLWIFTYNVYPEVNPKPEREIRERLTGIVLHGKPADERSAMLLSLIETSKLTRILFTDKKDHKVAKNRIKEIVKSFDVDQSVSIALKEVQAAVTAATTSAVITSVTAGGS